MAANTLTTSKAKNSPFSSAADLWASLNHSPHLLFPTQAVLITLLSPVNLKTILISFGYDVNNAAAALVDNPA